MCLSCKKNMKGSSEIPSYFVSTTFLHEAAGKGKFFQYTFNITLHFQYNFLKD